MLVYESRPYINPLPTIFGRHFQGAFSRATNPGLKPWAILSNRFAVLPTSVGHELGCHSSSLPADCFYLIDRQVNLLTCCPR
jgi:hypothetical protein